MLLDLKIQLSKKIIEIKKFVDAPFYIAGGYVFAKYKGNNVFHDIDIFFYNEKDFNKVYQMIEDCHFETDFAKTFYKNSTLYQIIRAKFGKPKEVFEAFDINCSKIAFTSENDLIFGDDFSDEIIVNYKNFKPKTAFRIFKYLQKGAKDTNNELYKAIEYLFENPDMYYEDFYNFKYNSIDALELCLKSFIQERNTNKYIKFILETLHAKYSGHELIKLLDKLYSDYYNLLNYHESDELALVYYLRNKKIKLNQSTIERLIEKYPEYLI